MTRSGLLQSLRETRPRHALGFLLAAAFWLAYSAAPEGVETDFWWHLKAGQLLLAGHAPFTTDPFSWTAAGRPWIQHEWLGEAILAAVYQVGGEPGVHSAYRVLLFLSFLLVAGTFRVLGCNLAVAGLGALLVHLHLYAQLWPRMQGFTLVGMAATCLLLAWRWTGSRSGWAVWAYPLGVALWANLHAGVIAGPLSCSFALLPELARLRRPEDRPAVLAFAAMTGLAWLSILANPIGWDLVRFILATLTDPEYRAFYAMTAEWGPFRLDYATCQYFLWWGVLILAALAVGGRKAVAPGMLLLALPWVVMACYSRRHIPLAAMASAPLAAALLATAAARYGEVRPRRRRIATVTMALAAIAITVSCALDMAAGPFRTNLAVPSDKALQAALAAAPARRMFNLYDWGGLLIFHGYPGVRVFIDGRQDVYGLELNMVHHRLMGAAPGWREELAARGVDMVFAPAWVPLVRQLASDPAWRVAYADATAAVLLKGKN
ncbi:MAG: hypothetical protein FJZ01_07060 [Candidatus Sericytochromatia bacterium]|nr:hypothetical protein [Candidatus Tanganyikabacteria bacterium]